MNICARIFGYLVISTMCGLPHLASGLSFEKISGEEGLGRIDLKNVKMNAESDFVAVSNSRIFVGNARDQRVIQLPVLNEGRLNFAQTLWESINLNGTNYRFTVEILQSRVAINNRGDFIVASNTLLWVGNSRSGQIRLVADAGAFADFQSVQINDQGQYVAISAEKIFSGHADDASAKLLIEEAVGNFGTAYIFAWANSGADATVGEQRLALNANGKFVAITSRTVYHGDVSTGSIEILHQEAPGQSFRHVSLSDSDQFVVVSQNEVFAGSLATN